MANELDVATSWLVENWKEEISPVAGLETLYSCSFRLACRTSWIIEQFSTSLNASTITLLFQIFINNFRTLWAVSNI